MLGSYQLYSPLLQKQQSPLGFFFFLFLFSRILLLIFVSLSCLLFFHRLSYGEGDIPTTLITYLNENVTYCPCGEICIDDGIPSRGSINLLAVSDSVSGDKIVPLEMRLCSNLCFQRFAFKVIHWTLQILAFFISTRIQVFNLQKKRKTKTKSAFHFGI